jgi:hypothetical protein
MPAIHAAGATELPSMTPPCGLAAGAFLLVLSCASLSPAVADETTPTTAAPRRAWDAAIGGVLTHAPDFAGSDRARTRLNPGLYLRYGRLSIATRSGFRSAGDPGERAGLRLDPCRPANGCVSPSGCATTPVARSRAAMRCAAWATYRARCACA